MPPTLHDEMTRILRLHGGGPLHPRQIAQTVNTAGRYAKGDGSSVSTEQIHARVSRYLALFERTPDGIRLRGGLAATGDKPPTAAATATPPEQPWYWEGNVQAALARHLGQAGWKIEQTADTASRERGIDLVATRSGERMAVEVKGYPASERLSENSGSRASREGETARVHSGSPKSARAAPSAR